MPVIKRTSQAHLDLVEIGLRIAEDNAPAADCWLDSIDALELVVGMERTFGVGVPNSEAARHALTSVNSIHDYIVANRK